MCCQGKNALNYTLANHHVRASLTLLSNGALHCDRYGWLAALGWAGSSVFFFLLSIILVHSAVTREHSLHDSHFSYIGRLLHHSFAMQLCHVHNQ